MTTNKHLLKYLRSNDFDAEVLPGECINVYFKNGFLTLPLNATKDEFLTLSTMYFQGKDAIGIVRNN